MTIDMLERLKEEAAKLEVERALLQRAIDALEGRDEDGPHVRVFGRKSMPASARRKLSIAMKRRWAERRAS